MPPARQSSGKNKHSPTQNSRRLGASDSHPCKALPGLCVSPVGKRESIASMTAMCCLLHFKKETSKQKKPQQKSQTPIAKPPCLRIQSGDPSLRRRHRASASDTNVSTPRGACLWGVRLRSVFGICAAFQTLFSQMALCLLPSSQMY